MVVLFNDATYAVEIAGVDTLMMLIAVAATVAVLPFPVLLAYILRIATVAKHTLSIGPFILREADDVREVEWNR